MAAAKLKAEKLSAAHARAEADEASFKERERVAERKRRVENQHRRVMNGERDKNRQRKLEAQTGREWDLNKKEEDYTSSRGRGSAYRRGAHGGIAYDLNRGAKGLHTGASETSIGENDYFRGRGRGGGRGGHGRGGGNRRGDNNQPRRPSQEASHEDASSASQKPPVIGAESEFPALPSASVPGYTGNVPSNSELTETNNQNENKSVPTPGFDDVVSPLTPQGGSWAEQVESSEPRNEPVTTANPSG